MAMSLWWWIKNIEFESLFTPWVFRADYGPKLSKTTALQRPEKVETNPHANPIEWLALYIRPDLFSKSPMTLSGPSDDDINWLELGSI